MKSYAKKMQEYIDKKTDKSFTTYEIQKVTNTTCPHSVVQDLKKIYKLSESWEQSCKIENGAKVYKNYKLFKVEGLICQ